MWRGPPAWSTKDTVLANTTAPASAATKGGGQTIRGRSNNRAATAASKAVLAICIHTRRRASLWRESSVRATICPPKQSAQIRVRRSPRFSPPASGAVRKYIPSPATASAAAVNHPGRWPSTTKPITGASTDEMATMNAEREGVVITSPRVTLMKPIATSAPSSRPPASSRPRGGGVKRVPGASSSAASPKRMARNANGVAEASALFTATKLVPHIAVATSSARSACRRVTRGPAGTGPWAIPPPWPPPPRSEEHTSELQSPCNLVCRLLLEKKKKKKNNILTAQYTP